jgi:hypothetical protein
MSANDNEEDLQSALDLRWKADMRAIARWSAATGKNLTLPDHADLCVWLLNRLMDAAEIMRPFANFSPKAEGFVENAAATPGASSIMPTKEFRLRDFKRAKEFFDTWNGPTPKAKP